MNQRLYCQVGGFVEDITNKGAVETSPNIWYCIKHYHLKWCKDTECELSDFHAPSKDI